MLLTSQNFLMTGTKLWRLLDKGETFFWFRASVSIEKKIGRLNQSKMKLLERYKLHSSFFLYLSLSIKENCFEYWEKSLNEYSATETTIGSFTGHYKIADINFEERKSSPCLVLLKGLIQAEKVNRKLNCVCWKRFMI